MDQDSTHMVAASKVSMLKPGEYEIWRMRIEQYIHIIDYALWEVIENGSENVAHLKTTVNAARSMSHLSKIAHSTIKSPIHKNTTFKNNNINQRVNIVKGKKINTARPKAVVNAAKRNNVNDVKASACWVWKPKTKVLDHGSKHIQVSDGLGPQKKLIFLSNMQGNPQMYLQDQGVIDSGCSRHMIGNTSYLIDYE
ncbi:hypothetical protein Tco_1181964 [Tanacetum coccineum]